MEVISILLKARHTKARQKPSIDMLTTILVEVELDVIWDIDKFVDSRVFFWETKLIRIDILDVRNNNFLEDFATGI